MTFENLVQGFSSLDVAEVMVRAFGRLFIFADNTYYVTQKVAFLILCAALIVHGWKGKAAQDIFVWIWALVGLLIAIIVIANWLDITCPPDGAAWQLGQAIANKIGDANPSSLSTFWEKVLDGFPDADWLDLLEALKQAAVLFCIILSQTVIFFMRMIQMAMIAILYSLGPIFVSFICIGMFQSTGIKYMLTLASMYTWDIAWKFADAGSEALIAFGSSTGRGYNPIFTVLALLWAIIAPIFLPIFLGNLFTSGATGVMSAIQLPLVNKTMSGMSAAGKALGNMSKTAVGKIGLGLATGGLSAIPTLAKTATSGFSKMMSGAKQIASNIGTGNSSQESSSSAKNQSSTSGSLQSGQSMNAGGTSIKRASDNSFSIGNQNFSGDPNNSQILYSALAQTNVSPTNQAEIRNAMRERQTV